MFYKYFDYLVKKKAKNINKLSKIINNINII